MRRFPSHFRFSALLCSLCVFLGGGVLAACGDDEASSASVRSRVETSFEEKYFLRLLSLNCAKKASLEEGANFHCSGLTESAFEVNLNVTVVDGELQVDAQEKVFETKDLAEEIRTTLLADEDMRLEEVEVLCNPIEFIMTDSSFECTVQSGDESGIIVVFVDKDFQTTWELGFED